MRRVASYTIVAKRLDGWRRHLVRKLDIGAGHIVLDGSQRSAKGAQHPPPLLGPCLLWPRSPISATAELLFFQPLEMMTTLLISHASALSIIHHSRHTQNSLTHSFTPGLQHTCFTHHPITDCWWPTTHRAISLRDLVAQPYHATKFHHFSSSRPSCSYTSRVRKLWTVKWFLHWAYAVGLQ